MRYINDSARTYTSVGGPRRRKRHGICIHTTMGYRSLAWLQYDSAKAGRPASADYLIDRNGDIHQISKPGRYAFHTGYAYWNGFTNDGDAVHQVLVGIELEAAEQHGEKITDAQYIALAALHRRLADYHDFDLREVTTHALIALPKGRKKDPIFFDNNVYRKELANPSPEAFTIKFPEVLA